MFIERGFEFTYEAVREWEEWFIPLLTEKLRARRKGKAGISWYIDETYVKKVMNRTNHYLNNRIEQAHRAIKQRYYPMRGFKSFESASRFCSGFDELRNFFKSGPKLSSPVLRRLQYRARIEAYQSIMKAA
jgi:transposase-like protein